MTDTEIINRLISIMNVGQHHKFLDEWHKIPGIPTESSGKMWTKDAKRILHLMTSKKIIRHIRNQDNDAIVELKDRGIKFKSEGGLKVDISKIAGTIIKFSKVFWIFLIGFFTIVPGAIFTYDRFIKDGESEPPKIQQDSTNVNVDYDTALLKQNANLLYQGNKYQDALLEYEKLIKTDSLNGQFYFRVGYCLAQLGKHSESVDYYLRSAELKFKEYDSYYSIGMLYYTFLNDDNKALYYFKKCLEIKPDAKDIQDMINKLNQKNRQINT